MHESKVVGNLYPGIFPHELGLLIEECYCDDQLLMLRQVCRDFHDGMQEKWSDAYFTRRTHAISYHGLSTLFEITARPALARKLEEIKLCIIDLKYGSTYSYDSSQLSELQTREARKLSAAWKAEQGRFGARRNVSRLLQDIFVNLKRQALVLPVQLTSDWRDPNGADNLLRKVLGRDAVAGLGELSDTQYLVRGRCEKAAKFVLEGLLMADYPVQQLDLACPYDQEGLTQRSFNLKQSDSSRDGPDFAHLTTLEIKLDPKVFVGTPDRFANIALCFRNIPRLHTLSIDVAYDDGYMDLEDYLTPMFGCLPLEQIRILALHGAYGEAEEYIAMLARASSSLERLEIYGCDVVVSSCWSEVFRWARDKMALLSWLRVSEIGRVVSTVYGHGDLEPRPVSWDGHASVREGLQMLSHEPRYRPVSPEPEADGLM